jgi:hypothetical protein
MVVFASIYLLHSRLQILNPLERDYCQAAIAQMLKSVLEVPLD